ncbi:MAG: dihydroorotate dehydrogenase 2 [Hydrotalea sp.]|nr:dihydroorotate dehydrogenase 2 [Hydrotalea sp.]
MLSFLRLLPPEMAHRLTLRLLPAASYLYGSFSDYNRQNNIAQELFGMTFLNPFGMAAGFDKNAVASRAIMRMGFGFLEVGTVTPNPQAGNPPPRLFRLNRERAIINRLGFPSDGMVVVRQNLIEANQVEFSGYKKQTMARENIDSLTDEKMAQIQKRWDEEEEGLKTGASWLWPCPLFINIGPNKNSEKPINDFAIVAKKLSPLASGFVINVSSPNTAGLRALQTPESLKKIIDKVRKVSTKPLLLKFSPDLTSQQVEAMAQFCLQEKIDGAVLTNTTIARAGVERSRYKDETGGLSGKPLFNAATRILAQFYLASRGKIPLIGVGGVMSPEDAVEKIRAGASLVEGYSGFVYHGRALLLESLKMLDHETKRTPLVSLIGSSAGEYAKY